MAAYPGTVRVWTTKVDLININYADDINQLQQEVTALETYVGLNPQGTFADASARMAWLEANKADLVHRHDILTDIDDLSADFAPEYLNNARHDTTTRHGFGSSTAFGNRVAASPLVATGASTGTKQGTANTPAAADHRHEPGTGIIDGGALTDDQKWWSGDIKASARANPPTGWVKCDGTAYSRTDPTYSSLFAAIGSTYGNGDGSTTFNVPDLRGTTPIGAGTRSGLTARTRGQFMGEEAHIITVDESWPHNHEYHVSGHEHLIEQFVSVFEAAGYGLVAGATGFQDRVVISGPMPSHTLSTDPGYPDDQFTDFWGGATGHGGDVTPHNNMQPSLVINYFIKL